MRDTRAALVGLVAVPALTLLAVVSLPFVFMSVGYEMLGDYERANWWTDHAPFELFMGQRWQS